MTSRRQGLLFLGFGFAIWMAALSSLYAVQAVGCEFAWQQIRLGPFSLLRAALIGLAAAHLGALFWLAAYCSRKLAQRGSGRDEAFVWRASAYLSVAAIAATVWIAAALPLPSICT
jgi:hypothetical protein